MKSKPLPGWRSCRAVAHAFLLFIPAIIQAGRISSIAALTRSNSKTLAPLSDVDPQLRQDRDGGAV
ncbi:hypothetical protein HaLaN_21379 [Haematococcus lacustris]|uniref:Uncharacterized protein n=1 Tax=Haematococcus lacustris TaxID=44745 RepID=A0A6A0A2N6_HAELA|nr:hypothetical protein HaLaN_21379 [Haematococcus lacustris]